MAIDWDAKHKAQDKDFLTGSSLWEIKKYHSLSDKDFAGSVLEIGVGTGSLRAQISPKAYYGCDISASAFGCGGRFFLSQDLRRIPPVDLAICHLVFQHNQPAEVERIINDVQLKKHGIFSFQIATKRDKLDSDMQEMEEQGLLYFLTADQIRQIVARSNKKIISSKKFSHAPFDWYVLRTAIA